MNLRPHRTRQEPDINLTSLIDVVFLLLIFFMISTTFNRETELSVQLPEASGDPMKTEQKYLEISIDAKGHYYVNRKEVLNTDVQTLRNAIAGEVRPGNSPQIIISADRMTPHQAVISAMDAARQLDLVHITFATSKPAEEK